MYHSNSSKYPSPETLHKKDGVKFWVTHLHDGNDPTGEDRLYFADREKKVPNYVTLCTITDNTGDIILGYGESICSTKDVPNRRLGHEIAVTRAIKNYLTNKSKHREQSKTDSAN